MFVLILVANNTAGLLGLHLQSLLPQLTRLQPRLLSAEFLCSNGQKEINTSQYLKSQNSVNCIHGLFSPQQ